MAELKIELISIGDEILIGHTLDTNSNWIAGRLSENGLRLRWISVVGDNASDLKHQLKRAWNRADVVLVTGGLGPTHDDITRPVIARFFDDEIVTKPELVADIRERFARRGLEMPANAEIMAQFPTNANPIPNQHGAAPGIHYDFGNHNLFAMPGVPREMKGMFADYVLSFVAELGESTYRYKLIKTAGTGESHLSELIGSLSEIEPVQLAFLPSIDHGVTLRISLSADDADFVENRLDSAFEYISQRIEKYIYAEGETSLEEVLLDLLRQRGMKLAVAESCTGGLVADRIVSVAGSSDVFDRGFVTYSNDSKIEMLGVDLQIIEQFGAVSPETALAMAIGARERAGVDIAACVTGIAGPTGGTPDKPVGLVYIAVADKKGNDVQRFRFTGDRLANRSRSAFSVLVKLWERLADK
ncbi:MAG: competence/damage-inducible protein A [Calditrichaeota bacterium]|nr:competence/damage-inducible protein A [Calditrichota bacterium]